MRLGVYRGEFTNAVPRSIERATSVYRGSLLSRRHAVYRGVYGPLTAHGAPEKKFSEKFLVYQTHRHAFRAESLAFTHGAL